MSSDAEAAARGGGGAERAVPARLTADRAAVALTLLRAISPVAPLTAVSGATVSSVLAVRLEGVLRLVGATTKPTGGGGEEEKKTAPSVAATVPRAAATGGGGG